MESIIKASKQKGRRSTPIEAETAGVERLVSKVGTPKKDERDEEEIDDNEEVNDASSGEDDVLDLAIEGLVKLEEKGDLPMEDLEILLDYVDAKLAQNVPRDIVAKRLSSPSQRAFFVKASKKAKDCIRVESAEAARERGGSKAPFATFLMTPTKRLANGEFQMEQPTSEDECQMES